MSCKIFTDTENDDVTLLMEFRAIAPEQHDFSLFKMSYIDDIDCIFFIRTPSVSHPMMISQELAERIMCNPSVGASLEF